MENFNISCTISFMVKNFVHLHILVKDSSTDWSVEKKNLVKIPLRASNYFILSVTYWVLNTLSIHLARALSSQARHKFVTIRISNEISLI